jgi:hypothetical protein
VIDLPIPAAADGAPDNPGNSNPAGGRWKPGKRWQLQSQVAGVPGLFDPPPARPSPAAPEPTKLQAVETLLELRKVLTCAEVQEQFGLDPAAARTILKHLTDIEVAVVEGKAKGTRYRLK